MTEREGMMLASAEVAVHQVDCPGTVTGWVCHDCEACGTFRCDFCGTRLVLVVWNEALAAGCTHPRL